MIRRAMYATLVGGAALFATDKFIKHKVCGDLEKYAVREAYYLRFPTPHTVTRILDMFDEARYRHIYYRRLFFHRFGLCSPPPPMKPSALPFVIVRELQSFDEDTDEWIGQMNEMRTTDNATRTQYAKDLTSILASNSEERHDRLYNFLRNNYKKL